MHELACSDMCDALNYILILNRFRAKWLKMTHTSSQ